MALAVSRYMLHCLVNEKTINASKHKDAVGQSILVSWPTCNNFSIVEKCWVDWLVACRSEWAPIPGPAVNGRSLCLTGWKQQGPVRMKITLKTLQQDTFQVEVEDDAKVAEPSLCAFVFVVFARFLLLFILALRCWTWRKRFTQSRVKLFLWPAKSSSSQVSLCDLKWFRLRFHSQLRQTDLLRWFFFSADAGKILNDDANVSEYSIPESAFVVIMVTKVSLVLERTLPKGRSIL